MGSAAGENDKGPISLGNITNGLFTVCNSESTSPWLRIYFMEIPRDMSKDVHSRKHYV